VKSPYVCSSPLRVAPLFRVGGILAFSGKRKSIKVPQHGLFYSMNFFCSTRDQYQLNLAPPLVITRQEVDWALGRIRQTLVPVGN
jgi:hypothetical protein